MGKDVLSVIVPIFNVEQYLPKCIDSICRQTYSKLDIILVDDGSKDDSGKICEEYKAKDERIKVVHKTNEGLTASRKRGLSLAKGEVVTFVDGDDWIEQDMYAEMMYEKNRHNADLIMSGMYRDNDSGTYTEWSPSDWDEGVYTGEDLKFIKNKLFYYGDCRINGSCCNKLFDKILLTEGLMYMDDELRGICDDNFVYYCFMCAERIVIKNKSYYHGMERNASATHSRFDNYYEMLNKAIRFYNMLMMKSEDSSFRTQTKLFLIQQILNGINHVTPDALFPRFLFPRELPVKKGDKIIIYGGGRVGEDYVRQIRASDSYEIVAWVDKYEKQSKYSKEELDSPEIIRQMEYDCIVIAVSKSDLAGMIRNEMINSGITGTIFWQKPQKLLELLDLYN